MINKHEIAISLEVGPETQLFYIDFHLDKTTQFIGSLLANKTAFIGKYGFSYTIPVSKGLYDASISIDLDEKKLSALIEFVNELPLSDAAKKVQPFFFTIDSHEIQGNDLINAVIACLEEANHDDLATSLKATISSSCGSRC